MSWVHFSSRTFCYFSACDLSRRTTLVSYKTLSFLFLPPSFPLFAFLNGSKGHPSEKYLISFFFFFFSLLVGCSARACLLLTCKEHVTASLSHTLTQHGWPNIKEDSTIEGAVGAVFNDHIEFIGKYSLTNF